MAAYYNEHDPFAASWLRALIVAGHIAPGEVDERSILEVRPDDLRGFAQCHFFAGIGVWSYALRRAGWADDRPVWTGSCPCQPFSAAGKGDEFADERHLWPAWFRLIRECRPVAVFGEQVASKDALSWLDHVSTDLEGEGYAVGAVDTCAAGFGAPHIRQRLYFVADGAINGCGEELPHGGRIDAGDRAEGLRAGLDSGGATSELADAQRRAAERSGLDVGSAARGVEGEARQRERLRDEPRAGGDPDGRGIVGDSEREGLAVERGDRGASREAPEGNARQAVERAGAPTGPLEHADRAGPGNGILQRGGELGRPAEDARPGATGELGDTEGGGRDSAPLAEMGREEVFQRRGCGLDDRRHDDGPRATNGFWANAEWIACRDGKARPVEPGVAPLAHGAPNRVGRLRGYGNAICAPQATEFVRAFMEIAK